MCGQNALAMATRGGSDSVLRGLVMEREVQNGESVLERIERCELVTQCKENVAGKVTLRLVAFF